MAHLLAPLLRVPDGLDGGLLLLPAGAQCTALLLQVGQFLLQFLQSFLAGPVLLLLERLPLNLQLHDAPVHLVQSGRLGVNLHPQPGGRLINQVNRLVRQVPVGNVAVAERGGRDAGRVLDTHAVVDFVPLLEAAQDADRVLHRRLVHVHRLEPPFQRGVLLDVLAVLV